MSDTVSFVLANYHSSSVAGEAVSTFRREADDLGLEAEVVIVDHSEDGAELERLRQIRPDVLIAESNRGYAAGVNLGLKRSTGGTVLAGNPDVWFTRGSLAPLLSALASGWDIVGPLFVVGKFLYPPADLQTPVAEAARWLAGRSKRMWHSLLRRELRRWRQAWEGTNSFATTTLSGALLAFRRETLDRVGPWDERYFLFFEETDWLHRARENGLRIAQAPASRIGHFFGHSADVARLGDQFLASRTRYYSSHFGWRGRLVTRLRFGRTPAQPLPFPARPDSLPPGPCYWLLSPSTLGAPAAGWFGPRSELAAALRSVVEARRKPMRYLLLAVDTERGRMLGQWWWEACYG